MSLVLLCSVVPPFPCVSPWPPHLRNSSSLDPPFSSALDEDRPRHGSMEQRLLVLEFLFDSSSSRSGPPIPYSSCSSLPVLQVRSGCWFREKRKMDVGVQVIFLPRICTDYYQFANTIDSLIHLLLLLYVA
ncbi:hypothetical protein VPH35_098693 [Triticum aestivum]